MQSSVFGGGYVDKQPLYIDNSVQKSIMGSTAHWVNENAFVKPNNVSEPEDAFRQRQNYIYNSNVFD